MDKFLSIMIPDDSPTCSPLTPIATLAFIDLETTGLPSDVGRKNVQITELAIVAVDRVDFEDDLSLRVANKLTIFIRPRANISAGAMGVSKLYNDVLERQKPFDESIPKMLDLFFSRLRSPICLLAHNGKGFDFPVLQAELKRVGYSLPGDVTCADTLEAFRTLGLIPPNEIAPRDEISLEKPDTADKSVEIGAQNNQEKNKPPNSNVMSDEDIDCLLSDCIEDFRDVDGAYTHSKTKSAIVPGTIQLHEKAQVNGFCEQHSVSYCKCLKSKKQHIDSYFTYRKKYSALTSKRELLTAQPLVKKAKYETIMSVNNTTVISPSKRNGFSLEKLYTHYFGEAPPKAHHADSDCINLCKVVQRVSNIVLPWLDANQVLFSKQTPMW